MRFKSVYFDQEKQMHLL